MAVAASITFPKFKHSPSIVHPLELTSHWNMNKYPVMPASEAFGLLSMNNKMSVIDGRSQGEYEKAHFENTLNIPILSDSHRHDVGLTYKIEGAEAAKVLGHKLVSGDYKEELISGNVNNQNFPAFFIPKQVEGFYFRCRFIKQKTVYKPFIKMAYPGPAL
jgi:hypothetical protein